MAGTAELERQTRPALVATYWTYENFRERVKAKDTPAGSKLWVVDFASVLNEESARFLLQGLVRAKPNKRCFVFERCCVPELKNEQQLVHVAKIIYL